MAKDPKDSRILEYKDTISQLNMTIRSQNELIDSLRQTIASNNEAMAVLNEKVDYLTKKLFGTSSEKSKNVEGQLSLFNEAEQEASPAGEQAQEAIVKGHARRAKSTHADIFKGVPARDEVISLSEEQRYCAECGAGMEAIGKEFVRREFRFTLARGEVVSIYRETAKCPACSMAPAMAGAVGFAKAHVQEALIPHSYASASAVAWTMYQKYANSMPLYRQEQDWKQMGVILSRATLANWILYCAGNYLSPLYGYFHRELIKRQFLMADETRIQVLKEPERNAETESFMWLFRTGEDGLPPIILYRYTQTRAGFHAADFLKGFKGYLETDCYQGYNGLPDVKRCCWAHLRRYFVEAVPKGKELDYSNPSAQGVQYCNKLFEYERQSREKGHSHEQRKEYRIQKEKPVLDAFWEWVSQQSPKKGTRFEKAVNYAQNHREQFMTYLEDGRCSFSNNLSENSIRPFTVGRRNWLFSDTPKGADASAMVYTMVEMAKAYSLNIYKYLKYLLEHLPETRMADSELSRLAPWNPEVIGRCSGTM
nr:IS66 family transposase [uncultured Acetatifactor sp.]